MGEIFEQVLPSAALEWTGERLTTGAGGQVEIEHLHRYILARDLCRGLDVLDVASGEGYGTALLAQVARSATGVEISAEAAGHAAAQYRAGNLRYLQGDARRIPMADASVDVVVSFETIEHFYEHDAFLSEVRRVLRPGGRFIVSSPDRDIYSLPGSEANAYHVRELSRDEFAALLARYFGHVQILGQRPLVGSALMGDAGPTVTIERRGPARFERSDGLPRAVYLVAVASDTAPDALPNSLFVESGEVGPILARAADHAPVSAALAETRARAEAAETAFHTSRGELARCMQDAADAAARAAAQIAAMDGEITRMQRELADPASAAGLEAARAEAREALARAETAEQARADAASEAASEAGRVAAARDAERDASRAEVQEACAQRDVARLALRRAAVFAENAWSARLVEMQRLRDEAVQDAARLDRVAEALREQLAAQAAAAEYWRQRYHTFRGRLERLIRRLWLYQASRLMPRPLRRLLRDRFTAGDPG